MLKRISMLALLMLFVTAEANAANVAVITTPPGLIHLFVLVFACACVVVAIQVRSTVKGGLLSRAWQWFAGSFALLAVSQVVTLLHNMEFFIAPEWMVPAIFGLMSAVLFFGVFETRRTLG